MSEPKSGRLEIRVPQSLIDAIEEWRSKQVVPPSRSAAIRYILEAGLRTLDPIPIRGPRS